MMQAKAGRTSEDLSLRWHDVSIGEEKIASHQSNEPRKKTRSRSIQCNLTKPNGWFPNVGPNVITSGRRRGPRNYSQDKRAQHQCIQSRSETAITSPKGFHSRSSEQLQQESSGHDDPNGRRGIRMMACRSASRMKADMTAVGFCKYPT